MYCDIDVCNGVPVVDKESDVESTSLVVAIDFD